MKATLLTFPDKEEGEGEHDGVATVQVVSTHDVGASDGQASSRHHLEHAVHLPLGITIQLGERGGDRGRGTVGQESYYLQAKYDGTNTEGRKTERKHI